MGLYGSSVISGPGQQLSLLPVIDMTGGLNLQRGGLQLLDSESPDMLNVDSQVAGGVCRRRGVTTGIGAALPSPICQVSWFENQVSTTQLIIVPLEDNTIWEIVAPGVGSPTIIPNWVGDCPRGIQINFQHYTYSLTQDASDYDGVTTTVYPWATTPPIPAPGVDGFPRAKYMTMHSGFAWAAHVQEPGDPSTVHCNRIWRSDAIENGAGELVWREDNWVDIDDGADGDCITGIIACGGFLYVFKRNSVYFIAGWDGPNIQVYPLCTDAGAVSQDAITCGADCKVWFFDHRRGLHSIEGQSINWEFDKMLPLIEDDCIPWEYLDTVTVAECNGKIFVSVPEGEAEAPDATYVLDPNVGRGAWTKYDYGIGPSIDYTPKDARARCLAIPTDKPGANTLIQIESDLETDYYGLAFGFEPIVAYWASRWFDGGNPYTRKTWCAPEFLASVPTDDADDMIFRFEYYADFDREYQIGAGEVDFYNDVPATGPTMEVRTPGAEPVLICPEKEITPSSSCLPDHMQRKKCGPKPRCRSCSMQVVVRGTLDESIPWCLNSMLVKFYEEPITC